MSSTVLENVTGRLETLAAPPSKKIEVLAVHGLNQNPAALKTLLNGLTSAGAQCHILSLPDHQHRNLKTPIQVTGAEVEDAYRSAFAQIKALADESQVPVGVIGFSYGGLLAVSHIEGCTPDRILLLAPALQLRSYVPWIQLLFPFVKTIVSAPLGGPVDEELYRYYRNGVPVPVYKNFFGVFRRFLKKQPMKISGIKGCVLIHPRDELVSAIKLKRWVQRSTDWEFHKLNTEGARLRRFKHLILDPKTLGLGEYEKLLSIAKNTLNL